MPGIVLDGKRVSNKILERLRPEIERLRAAARPPCLAVVLVGEDPASQIYVRNKIRTCKELGITSLDLTPPAIIDTDELLRIVHRLNADPTVDGILVQSPLPKQIDSSAILQAIDPSKDADGFHPYNVGQLVANRPAPTACTPAGIMELLREYDVQIEGKHAVVVGRSDIVGKPTALLLLHANATVTVCHSRTRDLAGECRRADILVAAIGKPALIGPDFIRPGSVIVDVGMNRVTDTQSVERWFADQPARLESFRKSGSTLIGDVDPLAMRESSSAYTPVPGGVGPLTIAMLMSNTVELARQHLAC